MRFTKTRIRLIFTFVIALLATLVLVACGDTDPQPNTFTVEFVMDGGTPQVPSQEVEEGGKVTRPDDPTKAGFEFDGWFKESTLDNEWRFNIDTVEANLTLYASWTPEEEVPVEYTVTFDGNGADDLEPSSAVVVEGGTVSQPIAIREGHVLIGWFKDEDLTEEWNFATDVVTENLTLYASWQETLVGTAINSQDELYDLLVGDVTYESGAVFYLAYDLDFDNYEWDGSRFTEAPERVHNFIFDGNGKTISNLEFTAPNQGGLISRMDGGSVSNLTLENVTIKGGSQSGILIGRILNGSTVTINNIAIINSSVEGGAVGVGGLIGHVQGAAATSTVTVSNVVLLGVDVVGNNNSVGGVLGDLESSTISITDVLAEVDVYTTGERVGAIIGESRRNGNSDDLPDFVLRRIIVKANLHGLRYLGTAVGRADNNISNHDDYKDLLFGEISDVISILNSYQTNLNDRNSGLLGRSYMNEPTNFWGVAYNTNLGDPAGQTVPAEFIVDTIAELPSAALLPFADWSLGELLPSLLGYELPQLHLVQLTVDGVTTNQYVTDGREVSGIYYDADELGAFKQWLLDGEPFAGPVTSDLELVAEFTAIHRVTFNSNGGSTVSAVDVFDTDLLTRPTDPTRAGYDFLGWFTDSELTESYDFETPVTGDLTLYAGWEDLDLPTYTVTFDTDGGSAIQPVEVIQGDTLTLPETPFKSGFTFGGWFTDVEREIPFVSSTEILEAITLYAKWIDDTEAPDGIAIHTAQEFYDMATGSNAVLSEEYYLAADLDFASFSWAWVEGRAFRGTLNGNGKTISNLTIVSTQDRAGIFYGIRNNAVISNINFVNVDISSTNTGARAGLLAGEITNEPVTLQNISIDGLTVAGNSSNGVGGLVGYVNNQVTVSYISIKNAEISSANQAVGGLFGRIGDGSAAWDITVSNIYLENVEVSGTTRVGGLFGETNGAQDHIVVTLTNVGMLNVGVTGTGDEVSAISGRHQSNPSGLGTFTNIYINAHITGSTVGHVANSRQPGAVTNVWFNGTLTGNETGTMTDNVLEGHPSAEWFETNLPTLHGNPFFAGLLVEQEVTYRVTFETNGGNSISPINLPEGGELTLPTPTRTGYEFLGWFKDSELTEEWLTEDVVDEDITLYAKWIDNVDPVIAVSPTPGELVLTPTESFILVVEVTDDNPYSLEVDHSLEGTLPEFTVYASEDNPYGSVEVEADFADAGVVVTYVAATQTFTIDFGVAVTHTHFVPSGITFYLVAYDTAGNASGSMYEVTPEMTFGYTFEVPTEEFTITFVDNNADSIEFTMVEALGGLPLTQFPTVTKDGFRLLGWFKDAALTEEWLVDDVVQEDITLYAAWQEVGEGFEYPEPVEGSIAIDSAADFLSTISSDPTGNYHLTADLDFSAISYTTPNITFKGRLDGQGFAIMNFTTAPSDRGGLFRYIDGGTIINLIFQDISVTSGNKAGIIAGEATGQTTTSTLENITIRGENTVSGSHNEGVGLLLGNVNANLVVRNISISGINTVTNSLRSAGSLIGRIDGRNGVSSLSFEDIYVTGVTVSATSRLGGVIGDTRDLKSGYFVATRIYMNVVLVNGTDGNIGSILGRGDGSNDADAFTFSDSLFIVQYPATDASDIGNFFGANRAIVRNNVYLLRDLNGVTINHVNSATPEELLTEAPTTQEWFEDYLPTIVNSDLWRFDEASSSYVLIIG